jgi:hypothetical protein
VERFSVSTSAADPAAEIDGASIAVRHAASAPGQPE